MLFFGIKTRQMFRERNAMFQMSNTGLWFVWDARQGSICVAWGWISTGSFSSIGQVTPVAITGTIILIPYLKVNTHQLVIPSGIYHCNSFEHRASVDFISGFPIFKLIAETFQVTRTIIPVMLDYLEWWCFHWRVFPMASDSYDDKLVWELLLWIW